MKLPCKFTVLNAEKFLEETIEKYGRDEGVLAAMLVAQSPFIVNTMTNGLYNTGVPGSSPHTVIGLREDELKYFQIEELPWNKW